MSSKKTKEKSIKFKDYSDPFFNPFNLKVAKNEKYVIDEIKPAYAIMLDSLDMKDNFPDKFLDTSSHKKKYKEASNLLSTYVEDVQFNKGVASFTAHNMNIIVVTIDSQKYVVKGEFLLRAINNFKNGSLDVGTPFNMFQAFIYDEEETGPYDSYTPIEIKITYISADSNNLTDYVTLIDRYESYDKNYISNIKDLAEVFIF